MLDILGRYTAAGTDLVAVPVRTANVVAVAHLALAGVRGDQRVTGFIEDLAGKQARLCGAMPPLRSLDTKTRLGNQWIGG